MATTGSIDQVNMRRSNLAFVLKELIREPRSRAQLALDIGMTKGAVGSLVGDLISRGLVELSEASSTGSVGRPGQVAAPRPGRAFAVGVSFSPPYVISSVDLTGSVIGRERVTLDERIVPAEQLVAHAETVVRRLVEQAPAGQALLAGVAVGVPDLVDHRAGIVHRSPTVGLTEYPLARAMAEALADLVPGVAIDNDATFGALAESRHGAFSPAGTLLYLTGSTAMGGGIVIDGVPFRGSAGYAGEVGHMLVNPEGAACVCGNRGCWESEVGLNAFLSRLGDIDPANDGDELVSEAARRARSGDPVAVAAVLDMYAGAIGAAPSVMDRVVADPAAVPRLGGGATQRAVG